MSLMKSRKVEVEEVYWECPFCKEELESIEDTTHFSYCHEGMILGIVDCGSITAFIISDYDNNWYLLHRWFDYDLAKWNIKQWQTKDAADIWHAADKRIKELEMVIENLEEVKKLLE